MALTRLTESSRSAPAWIILLTWMESDDEIRLDYFQVLWDYHQLKAPRAPGKHLRFTSSVLDWIQFVYRKHLKYWMLFTHESSKLRQIFCCFNVNTDTTWAVGSESDGQTHYTSASSHWEHVCRHATCFDLACSVSAHMMLALCTAVTLRRPFSLASLKAYSAMRSELFLVMIFRDSTTPGTLWNRTGETSRRLQHVYKVG